MLFKGLQLIEINFVPNVTLHQRYSADIKIGSIVNKVILPSLVLQFLHIALGSPSMECQNNKMNNKAKKRHKQKNLQTFTVTFGTKCEKLSTYLKLISPRLTLGSILWGDASCFLNVSLHYVNQNVAGRWLHGMPSQTLADLGYSHLEEASRKLVCHLVCWEWNKGHCYTQLQ